MRDLNDNKCVIFDFDGTIADSFKIFLQAAEKLIKFPRKITPLEIEELRNLSLKEVIDRLNIKPWQIPRLIVKGRKEVKKLMPSAKIFNGMDKELGKLSENYDLYILSSNSPESIEDFIKRFDIDICFKRVYGDIGLSGKTNALRKLAKAEGIDISECIYVGDETRDVAAARRAGMKIVSVGWGFSSVKALNKARPDMLVKKPIELASAIDKIASTDK